MIRHLISLMLSLIFILGITGCASTAPNGEDIVTMPASQDAVGRKEIDRLEKDLERLGKGREKLQDQIREMEDKLTDLRRELYDAGTRIRDIKYASDDIIQEKEKIQKDIDRLDEEAAGITASIYALAGAAPAATETEQARPAKKPAGGNEETSSQAISLVATGNRLLAAGDTGGAEKAFRTAANLAPGLLSARLGIAACLFAKGEFGPARALVEAALEEDDSIPQGLALHGLLEWNDGNLRDAERSLSRAVKGDPGNAQYHNYYGIVLHDRGKERSAIRELEKAVELSPNAPDYHYNLAVVLAGAKSPDLDRAREVYQKALRLGSEADSELEAVLNAP